LIRVHALTKRYGQTLALDRFGLEVPAGGVLGLLGPNGAGKSTLLRLLMGFIFPDGGEIDRGGLVPAQIGYVPELPFYPYRFRVREYLTLAGRLAGSGDQRVRRRGGVTPPVQALLESLDLERVAGQRIGACSKGMLQRLGLAQALLGDPPLLLLDEPIQGLDPAGQKFMRDQILALQQAGKTVILSSHNLGEVTRVCTHIALLNRGRLARLGLLSEILPLRAQLSITTGPIPDELLPRLAALDQGVRVSARRIALQGDAVLYKVQVLLLLMEAGVDIRDLREEQATLEDVYLEATSE
jgi:ABC-2 type transport system ATP-binding protein